MTKVTNYQEAITELESIDSRIKDDLEEQNYSAIIKALNSRMVIISQLNLLNRSTRVPEQYLKKLRKIVENTEQLQSQISKKRSGIKERLGKHKSTKRLNKNFGYRS